MNKNRIYIVIFLVYLLFLLNAVISYVYDSNKGYFLYKNDINSCKIGEYCIASKDKENCQKYCDDIIKIFDGTPKKDFMYIFFEMLYNERTMYIQLLSPILIGILGVWEFILDLKSGNMKNKITRTGYKKYMTCSWVKSIRFSLILPIFCVFLFLFAFIIALITKAPMNTIYDSINFYAAGIGSNYGLLLVGIINLGLQSILWINLFYLGAKKSRNIVLSFISAYLLYLGIWMLSEILPVWTAYLINQPANSLKWASIWSLTNIWTFSRITFTFLYQMVLVILSSIFVHLHYRNKEVVLIDNGL